MSNEPRPEAPTQTANSQLHHLRSIPTKTPPGRVINPEVSSRTACIPPTPTPFRPKVCCISGTTTTKLCSIQWNPTWPTARADTITRAESLKSLVSSDVMSFAAMILSLMHVGVGRIQLLVEYSETDNCDQLTRRRKIPETNRKFQYYIATPFEKPSITRG